LLQTVAFLSRREDCQTEQTNGSRHLLLLSISRMGDKSARTPKPARTPTAIVEFFMSAVLVGPCDRNDVAFDPLNYFSGRTASMFTLHHDIGFFRSFAPSSRGALKIAARKTLKKIVKLSGIRVL
jgi:hypothetical protein